MLKTKDEWLTKGHKSLEDIENTGYGEEKQVGAKNSDNRSASTARLTSGRRETRWAKRGPVGLRRGRALNECTIWYITIY